MEQGAFEEVTFHDPGPLGMQLVKQVSVRDGQEYFVLNSITPGSPADNKPDLRTGQILQSISGELASNFTLPQLTQQLMNQRPITLRLVYRTADVNLSKLASSALTVGLGMKRWASRAQKGLSAHEGIPPGHVHGGEHVTLTFHQQKLGLVMGEQTQSDGTTCLAVEQIKPGTEAAQMPIQASRHCCIFTMTDDHNCQSTSCND